MEPKSEKVTKEITLSGLLFNVMWCLRRPKIEAGVKGLKVRVESGVSLH